MQIKRQWKRNLPIFVFPHWLLATVATTAAFLQQIVFIFNRVRDLYYVPYSLKCMKMLWADMTFPCNSIYYIECIIERHQSVYVIYKQQSVRYIVTLDWRENDRLMQHTNGWEFKFEVITAQSSISHPIPMIWVCKSYCGNAHTLVTVFFCRNWRIARSSLKICDRFYFYCASSFSQPLSLLDFCLLSLLHCLLASNTILIILNTFKDSTICTTNS